MASHQDRLSNLAESLLSYEILSRLSLRDAITSSILSTRWRSLWTNIPHLRFSEEFFASICPGKYTDIIDDILRQHTASLTSFSFEPSFRCECNTEKMEEWIECIRAKEVKEISIRNGFSLTIQVPTTIFSCQTLTTLKLKYFSFSCQTLTTLKLKYFSFSCQTLTTLKLKYFSFTQIPESCLGFPCLISCSLHFVYKDIESNIIENFIALCPQLQNLRLRDCCAIDNLKICAQNLKYLKLKFCSFDTLILDCPQLMKLNEISCDFWGLEEDNGSGLSSSLCDVNVSDYWLLESMSAAKTMKKISVGKCELPCVSSFLNMLSNFPNLENLTINECIVEKRNMAAGREMETASDISFPNLKEVFVGIQCMTPGNEVAILNFFLGNAPSLKILTINLQGCCPEVTSEMLDLKKASTEVEIRIYIEVERDH
ncbi:hypothetical protein SUGI_0596870 [Cryptomeria japonica]|nr:hypothetical protein SUGI_0596870 [Cryptomeria japonica]